MSTAKDNILGIYPDATVIKDTRKYTTRDNVPRQFLIVCNVPKLWPEDVKNGVIELDAMTQLTNFSYRILSTWCENEEQSWNDAWERLQQRCIRGLSE